VLTLPCNADFENHAEELQRHFAAIEQKFGLSNKNTVAKESQLSL